MIARTGVSEKAGQTTVFSFTFWRRCVGPRGWADA